MTSTTLYTLTSSGQVVVVTSVVTTVVRPSGTVNGTSSGGRSLNGDAGSSGSFFSNTGAVAGTFAAVGLIAAGLVIGLAFFFLRRKKKRQLDEDIRVAAGGAGDGGAGKSRFADDEDDPFVGGPGSDGHHSNGYHPPTMSSYGTVPLTAAAAAYASNGRRSSYNDGRRSMSSFDQGMQSQNSHPNIAGYGSSAGGGAAAYADYQAYGPGFAREERSAGPRSHEGALYPSWAEYVEGDTPPGRSSGEGDGSGSAEGMSEPFPYCLLLSIPEADIVAQWDPARTTTVPLRRSSTPGAAPSRRTTLLPSPPSLQCLPLSLEPPHRTSDWIRGWVSAPRATALRRVWATRTTTRGNGS